MVMARCDMFAMSFRGRVWGSRVAARRATRELFEILISSLQGNYSDYSSKLTFGGYLQLPFSGSKPRDASIRWRH